MENKIELRLDNQTSLNKPMYEDRSIPEKVRNIFVPRVEDKMRKQAECKSLNIVLEGRVDAVRLEVEDALAKKKEESDAFREQLNIDRKMRHSLNKVNEIRDREMLIESIEQDQKLSDKVKKEAIQKIMKTYDQN